MTFIVQISWFTGSHADTRDGQRVCLEKRKQADRGTAVLALL